MATWDPEGIDIADCDGLGEEDDNWDERSMNDLQKRYEELRQFNIKYNKVAMRLPERKHRSI